MPETITQGTPVRFTADHLGLVLHVGATKFEPEEVNEGDEGVYDRLHPVLDDWHIIKVGELYCPCHVSQFEVI